MSVTPPARRTRPAYSFAGMAIDLLLPIVVFYGLRSIGVAAMPALLGSALPPLVSVALTVMRGRRLDALGCAVAAGVLVGALLSLTSGDPRALLMRDAWEELYASEPRVRRIWRVTAAIWAGAFGVDAGLRAVMAAALPVDVVPAASAALWPVTVILLQVVTNVYLAVAGFWRILLAEPMPAGERRP